MEENRQNMIRRGDVYYVRKYPTYGSEQQAARPAIVVSNDYCNESSEVVEVVYLTTQRKAVLPTHVEIDCGGRRSIALCEQITSVSTQRLGDFKCRVTPDEMLLVDHALATSVGIAVKQDECEKILEHWYPDDERMLAMVCLKYLQRVLGKNVTKEILYNEDINTQ